MVKSLIAIALFAFAGVARAAEPTALEKAILPIAEAHKGKIAVAVKNLATGESYQLRGDASPPSPVRCHEQRTSALRPERRFVAASAPP